MTYATMNVKQVLEPTLSSITLLSQSSLQCYVHLELEKCFVQGNFENDMYTTELVGFKSNNDGIELASTC